MKLSPHFSLQELTFSQTAVRLDIDNTPTPEVMQNLKELCIHVLEPLREFLKKPVLISSGYRSAELNHHIGGARNSQHVKGQAVDIKVPGMTTEHLFQFIQHTSIQYDQLIEEFATSPTGGWVHISYSDSPRKQSLRATKDVSGKTVYVIV